jgi:hypothetical protein
MGDISIYTYLSSSNWRTHRCTRPERRVACRTACGWREECSAILLPKRASRERWPSAQAITAGGEASPERSFAAISHCRRNAYRTAHRLPGDLQAVEPELPQQREPDGAGVREGEEEGGDNERGLEEAREIRNHRRPPPIVENRPLFLRHRPVGGRVRKRAERPGVGEDGSATPWGCEWGYIVLCPVQSWCWMGWDWWSNLFLRLSAKGENEFNYANWDAARRTLETAQKVHLPGRGPAQKDRLLNTGSPLPGWLGSWLISEGAVR